MGLITTRDRRARDTPCPAPIELRYARRANLLSERSVSHQPNNGGAELLLTEADPRITQCPVRRRLRPTAIALSGRRPVQRPFDGRHSSRARTPTPHTGHGIGRYE